MQVRNINITKGIFRYSYLTYRLSYGSNKSFTVYIVSV